LPPLIVIIIIVIAIITHGQAHCHAASRVLIYSIDDARGGKVPLDGQAMVDDFYHR